MKPNQLCVYLINLKFKVNDFTLVIAKETSGDFAMPAATKRRQFLMSVPLVGATALASSDAVAQPLSTATSMPTLDPVLSKKYWGIYIDRYPRLAAEKSVLSLGWQDWVQLVRVNSRVNAERWRADASEQWDHTLPGDCENFALHKRLLLFSKGLPLGALRVCVGQITRRGRTEQHAVLHVVTDRGDFVLDQRTDDVLSWEESSMIPLYRTASGRFYEPVWLDA